MEFWAILTRFVNSVLFETASSGDLEGVFLSEDDARDVFDALIDAERKAGSLIGPIPKGRGLERNTMAGTHIEALDAACCMHQEDYGVLILLVGLVKITQPSKEECIAKLNDE
jgi:hypothetical protein